MRRVVASLVLAGGVVLAISAAVLATHSTEPERDDAPLTVNGVTGTAAPPTTDAPPPASLSGRFGPCLVSNRSQWSLRGANCA